MQLLSLSADLGFGLGLRSLDPALALLGTNAEGLAIDGPSLRAVVRSPGLNWSGNINDLLTYASPSTKYIWQNGILVPGTTLRCDHDPATGASLGVRIETQATNLLVQNCNFATTWVKSATMGRADVSSIVSGQVASKFTGGGGSSESAAQSVALSNTTAYTFWTILEEGSAPTAYIGLRNDSAASWIGLALFTWSTGAIVTAAGTLTASGVINLGTGPNGGRLRLVWASTSTGTEASRSVSIYPNGINPNTATTIVHATQIEAGSYPSSLIVTGTSAVTRAADNITLPLDAFPWNGGSGTLKLNGATVTPILNGGSTALDIDAMVAAASATHIKTLTWVPA